MGISVEDSVCPWMLLVVLIKLFLAPRDRTASFHQILPLVITEVLPLSGAASTRTSDHGFVSRLLLENILFMLQKLEVSVVNHRYWNVSVCWHLSGCVYGSKIRISCPKSIQMPKRWWYMISWSIENSPQIDGIPFHPISLSLWKIVTYAARR